MLAPSPGLVVHYGYLWAREREAGAIEGRKDRPCVIVLVEPQPDVAPFVSLCPITHSPLGAPEQGVELPAATKRRLGLDEERSWVVVTEVNRFHWPGFDLRRTPEGREMWGELPPVLLRAVIERLNVQGRQGRLSAVGRDD